MMQERDEYILRALARYGALSSIQIAQLLIDDDASAHRIARRVLHRLHRDRYLIRSRDGSRAMPYVYALAASGVRVLQEYGVESIARGADTIRSNSTHRQACNDVAIEHERKGLKVWTEREIQTGKSPITEHNGKVPDVLIAYQGRLVWVEVENSRKSQKDLERFTQWLAYSAFYSTLYIGEYLLDRVAIVVTSPAAAKIENRLRNELKKYDEEKRVLEHLLFEYRSNLRTTPEPHAKVDPGFPDDS